MTKHKNIPVFIPHLGCPNDCVFCNQHRITAETFDENAVKPQIDEAVGTLDPGDEAEIAFFGGSFTGIDRDLMIRLLKLGYGYVKAGKVRSLRCSTRPDYIDGDILDILSGYGVGTVELGIQSTDDAVLAACKRGHTAKQSFDAMRLIKERGFGLIGQMMVGLPGASPGSEIKTAKDICEYCDGGRIYPIVVFKDTELAFMAARGDYAPLTSDELVTRTADVKEIFISRGKPTIRIGLQANEGLTGASDIACGIYDEAIGEKCETEIYYRVIKKLLKDNPGAFRVAVPRGHISKAAGQRRSNRLRLQEEFGIKHLKFTEKDIPPYTAMIPE